MGRKFHSWVLGQAKKLLTEFIKNRTDLKQFENFLVNILLITDFQNYNLKGQRLRNIISTKRIDLITKSIKTKKTDNIL